MSIDVLIGILIPFVGTALGAACVFFLKNQIPALVQKGLLGFASGVMVAASVWSLLIPAIEMSEDMGRMAFVPGAVGIAVGMAFLLLMDRLVPHLHLGAEKSEGLPAHLKKTTMLVLAVTLHNIPEGMAVGVAFAGYLSGEGTITLAGAAALCALRRPVWPLRCASCLRWGSSTSPLPGPDLPSAWCAGCRGVGTTWGRWPGRRAPSDTGSGAAADIPERYPRSRDRAGRTY